ncbi:MAG TPA: NAD-dependent succinate-semialdehyde dehydrogenase [Anaeromyxobacteraceae bacterium]|nr:NAD-dependent succinate-semialdehyde dehydrogenase [Anaeromyxobacteraceae bacterium]
MSRMESVNPATGEVLARFDELDDAQIEAKLARAAETFATYRRTPFAERSRAMSRAAEIIEREKDAFGRTMTLEMGKTLKSAVAEAEKCAWVCRFYAENAERFLANEVIDTGGNRSFVRYLPLGPVLAVMPWNFPFWQVFRFAAPALMAGNVGLLKHASNVPQCALAIEDIFRRAGFPEGAFQTLLIGSSKVRKIIEDPRVAAVTLTGSEGAGEKVGEASGRALKKVVLELGGSDPFIVMPSADLDSAAKIAVTARCINNGQSCIAAKRFIVHDQVYDEFERRMAARLAALKIGDPMQPEVDIGPLATPQGVDDVERQVDASVKAGARLVTGGKRLGGKGNFYPPSLLADIPPAAPAYREEVFGPVALLFRVKSLDEAIALANDSQFGLGSAAWTNDPAEQARFIDEIEAGATFINGMVASDPRLPFGGVKRSGHGRELAEHGIREFVNAKSVVVAGAQKATVDPGTHAAE